MAFLGRIFKNLGECLSTHEEWHALVIGFGYGYCPWTPAFPISAVLRGQVIKEHHYYMVGTVLGFAGFIFTIAGAVAYVLGVVL